MTGLTALVVRRPTLVVVFVVLALFAGVLAYPTLVKQQFPNVDVPTIQIPLQYPGASTSEMRDAVVKPIEDQLAGAPGLEHIDSTVQVGQATIAAYFSLDTNETRDLVEVQKRFQSAQYRLPSDLQTPNIVALDPSATVVVTLAVSSTTRTPAELSMLVIDDIDPALTQLPGVSNVGANGTVTSAIVVNVDPAKLNASGSTLDDVVSAIGGNNVRAPGGIATTSNRETDFDVRGDVRSPASVADQLLTTSASSSLAMLSPWSVSPRYLRIRDVADVGDGNEVRRVVDYVDGRPSITLNVQKATGASEVDASNAVLAALPGLERRYPDLRFTVLSVQSAFTQTQLDGVRNALVEAIVLTSVVMLFFLKSWRNAIVVMIAIPTSLSIALAVMKLTGFTLDTVSLGAMTLVVGILVDDSTVVLENIERHRDDLGEDPTTAAIRGRGEIALAAVTLTLVDVVVFLPIAFLPGTVGRFLKEFGLVVTVATLASLLVSFTVTPAMAGRWSMRSRWKPPGIIEAGSRGFEAVRRWYVERALPWGLAHQVTSVTVALAVTLAAVALVPLGVVGFEFIPTVDRGEIFVQVTEPVGTPLAAVDATMRALEREVDALPDLRVESTLVGGYAAQFGNVAEGNVGQIHLFLNERRGMSTDAATELLIARARAVAPSARVVAIPATSTGGGTAQPIDEIVAAPGRVDLTAIARRVSAALAATPGSANVSTSAGALAPQYDVEFDRDVARSLDVSVGSASQAVRAAFGGVRATQFNAPDGLRYVSVIYPFDARRGIAPLQHIRLRATNGATVYVGDIARFTYAPQPPLLTRINRDDVVHIGANVVPGYAQSNVSQAFAKRLAALGLPVGVRVAPNASGSQQNLTDTVRGTTISLALSFALVYLLMVALYDGVRTPLAIMFAIPGTVVGALGSLALTHSTLNLFSLIGIVLLVGLVTKNGILLVDFADTYRNETGADRRGAIVHAAGIRFRPILMTTTAMIAGMLPLALALDPGSNVRQAQGIVVIGGLISSLLITLVIVPIAYVRLAPEKIRTAGGVADAFGIPPTAMEGNERCASC